MDEFFKWGLSQGGFAFLWGVMGYIMAFLMWRKTSDVLDKISSVLDGQTNTLQVIRDELDLAKRVDALAKEVLRGGATPVQHGG